jgi:hypothetical protein
MLVRSCNGRYFPRLIKHSPSRSLGTPHPGTQYGGLSFWQETKAIALVGLNGYHSTISPLPGG